MQKPAVTLMVKAARAAGNVLLRHMYKLDALNVVEKDRMDYASEVDELAEKEIIKEFRRSTPDYAILGEESGQTAGRGGSRFTWVIDPLDGTKEFLAHNGEFTVNIALIEDGLAVLGVVLAPALGQNYWGCPGHSAFRETAGKVDVIHVTTAVERAGRPLGVLASKSHMNHETQAFLEQLGSHALLQTGSSLKFCRIAEGNADLYPRLGPTCEWDTAAGQAVLEAAGGDVCLTDGTPLRYGKSEARNPNFVAAASRHLW